MYFCVKTPMKIGAKSFRTCICYALPDYLRATVEQLVEEGKAEIFAENRFFCNGKLVENARKQAKAKKHSARKDIVKEAQAEEEVNELLPVEEPIADETSDF